MILLFRHLRRIINSYKELGIPKSIYSSLLGGFCFTDSFISISVQIIFLIFLITFFNIFLYVNTSQSTKLIACGILTAFISIIKLIIYIFQIFNKYSFDLSDSESSEKEERPSEISPEVWETRKMLKDPKPDLETVISDLISSGIEANSILRLVDYLNNTTNNQIEEKSTEADQKKIVNICGHLYTLPFNLNSIEKNFPINFNLPVLILSIVFGFGCCYLPLSLSEQFYKREKWWLSIVCSLSIFSILKPPFIDPYITSEYDPWISLCRPFAVTIVCTFWSVSIDVLNKHQVIQFQFYNFEINLQKVCPYIFDICRYILLLLPVWIMVGIIGHPLSTMISILEGSCRYFFGQNGVKNVGHLVVQIIRGVVSVSCCWALLNYKMNEFVLSLSITIATFLNCVPIYCNVKKMRSVLVSFIYPVLLSATAFISSYCLGFLLIRKGNKTKEIVLYFSLAWFVCVDIIFPFFNSCQRYFIIHMRILKSSIPYMIYIRNFSQMIVGPLFLFACLFGSSFHPLVIAFIIVHSTHKYNTEPHVFAFAVFLTTLTLPYDFELTQNYSANLLISLLIAAKVEVFLPQLYFICHARIFIMDFWIEKFRNFEFFLTLYMPFMNWCPFFDLVYKVPSLFWSFFTGSSFISKFGVPFYSYSSSPRSFYFFDFPHKNNINDKFPFQNITNQCIIEKSIYASLTKSLSKNFASIVRSGRIGLVNSGDMFLFKKDNLLAMVHVISQEPSVMRIQVRGLLNSLNSIYNKREVKKLTEMENKYTYFPNFLHALYSTYFALDFRSKSIPLKAFNINHMNVEKIFLNFEYNQIYELFLASFAFIVAKRRKHIIECPNSNLEVDENDELIIAKIQLIVSKCSQNNNINNDESIYEDDEDDDSFLLNENEIKIVVKLWKIITSVLFVTEYSQLKTNMFFRSFNGNIKLSEQFLWIYDFPALLNKIVKPSIQLGVCCTYIISTNNGPQFDSNGQIDVDELVTFLNRTNECTVFANIQSKLFYKAYNQNKSENIISMATITKEDKILHFKLCTESWNVFQIMQEWVRSLWSDCIRNFLLFGLKNSGAYITRTTQSSFFNILLELSNDPPFGNPVFVSEIIDSYINPFSSNKY